MDKSKSLEETIEKKDTTKGLYKMKEMFAGLIDYDEEDFRELWNKATFVVDTNILINFFKYTSKDSTQSLLSILKKLDELGRLWIPHQVALEYLFNYESNMLKEHEGYRSLIKQLLSLKEESEKVFRRIKSEYPYIETNSFQFFNRELKNNNIKLERELEKKLESLPNVEDIKEEIAQLMRNSVGSPYTQEEINRIQELGKQRYQFDIPPGFMDAGDADKQGYRIYGKTKYQQLYGDLIMWKQIIDKVKSDEKTTPIIFITEEKKEDWWEKEQTKIKRPHSSLIKEFQEETGQRFYMYRTDNFVKYAKKYLRDIVKLTDQQVESVKKDITGIRKSEEENEYKNKKFIKIGEKLYRPTEDIKVESEKALFRFSDKNGNSIKVPIEKSSLFSNNPFSSLTKVPPELILDILLSYGKFAKDDKEKFEMLYKNAMDNLHSLSYAQVLYEQAIYVGTKAATRHLEKEVEEIIDKMDYLDRARAGDLRTQVVGLSLLDDQERLLGMKSLIDSISI